MTRYRKQPWRGYRCRGSGRPHRPAACCVALSFSPYNHDLWFLIDQSINLHIIEFVNVFHGRGVRMPKVGVAALRKDALIRAAIKEVGQAGSLDVTVSQIADRAGVSSALAHHYFGSKEQIFLSSMRYILH